MATSSSNTSPPTKHSLKGKKTKWGAIAVVLLVAAYSVAVPWLNRQFDLQLPQLTSDAAGNVRVVDSNPTQTERGRDNPTAKSATGLPQRTPATRQPRTAASEPPTNTKPGNNKPGNNKPGNNKPGNSKPGNSKPGNSKPGNSTKASGPLADRLRPTSRQSRPAGTDERSGTAATHAAELNYGLLREVSRDRFLSPAGLMYTPGSAEGHRLEHLRRHTKDDPGRPGSHGVFDGEMEGALRTIDRAYERAQKGVRTTKKRDRGRTIYTVDMGGRVGFVGGRDGNRKRKPMARRVRLVLEGTRVITAYPL